MTNSCKYNIYMILEMGITRDTITKSVIRWIIYIHRKCMQNDNSLVWYKIISKCCRPNLRTLARWGT